MINCGDDDDRRMTKFANGMSEGIYFHLKCNANMQDDQEMKLHILSCPPISLFVARVDKI